MVAGNVAPGQLIADRYLVMTEVGRGGMAVVYCAHDKQLDRDVALKLIDAGPASDEGFSAAFISEARAAAALSHPNIATVFDVGEHEGRPFIVMELVEGGDLRSLIRTRGRLEPLKAASLAYGIARALAALHGRGLVHCDVKPQNVLLTRDRQPKLVDFGIARVAAATGAIGRNIIVGSAPYLSPEQVRGDRLDPRTDVYALGILLYELLAGEPPFTGTSIAQVATQRLHATPRPVRQLAPDTPPELAAVVERALSLGAEERYPSAAEMAQALAPLADTGDASFGQGTVDGRLKAATADPHAVQTQRYPRNLNTGVPSDPWSLRIPGLTKSVLAGRFTPLLAAVAALLLLGFTALGLAAWRGGGAAPGVAVPAVAGMKLEEAAKRLQEAGLQVTKAEEPITLDTPRGVVVTQDPPAGKSAQSGEQVRLVVSNGIELPNLLGQHWDSVKPWMDQNGWRLGQVRFVFADQKDFGKVVAQDPAATAGPVADKQNTAINLNIAGPPEATRTGFPRQSAPAPEAAPPAEPARSERQKPSTGQQRSTRGSDGDRDD